MAQLPEIARLTLKRTASPAVHPDPGQLAAFGEQALPRHQRAYVLDHLANCVDCRELLRLSLPEPVAVEQQVPAPGRSWSFWESLRRAPVRWAGVAATAAVVATAVWVGQLQNPTTPLPTQAQIFRAEPQTAQSTGEPSKATAASPQSNVAAAPNAEHRFLLDPQTITAPTGGSPASSTPAQNSPDIAARAFSLAAAAQQSSKLGLNIGSAPLSAESHVPASSTGPSASAPSSDSLWATGMLTSPPQAAATSRVPPQWAISANGILRRSLDNGATWQDYGMQVGARLRAVVAVADQVWVGGSNGMLYHSANSGEQWQRVIPASPDGRSLTGDVVSVEFSNVQNGAILTSTGERWTTNDGGQSWRRN